MVDPGKRVWPENRKFAFTIFDDPDAQIESESIQVYALLRDLGFRTTKGVWPLDVRRERNSGGDTLEIPSYRKHCVELQEAGFEIGYHNAAPHSVTRDEIVEALDLFRSYFGCDPATMANHYNRDAMYWGPARLDPPWRQAYVALTRGKASNRHFGHVDGHASFWGDICRERIRSCRNFVFSGIDTLAHCPLMPYYDPHRPYVREWYASTEGAQWPSFEKAISERNQDRLAESGGACIMYTHFGHGFIREDGKPQPRFVALMTRLSRLGGWYVPVNALLDFLRPPKGPFVLRDEERSALERRWLFEKVFRGTS